MSAKVIFYVGRAVWGKSCALYYFAGESSHRRWIELDGKRIFVRHMSNDDVPQSYIEFMKKVDPKWTPIIVAALCADFEHDWAKTDEILDGLKKKGYELFFWVMIHKWGAAETITPDEIAQLKKYGEVEEYTKIHEAKERANSFRPYVRQIIGRA